MERSISATDARIPVVVFYDVELDDAGLNPYEFRIYQRIARRSGGGHHDCTESVLNMAKACMMSRPSAVRAIAGLVRRQMLQRIHRDGATSHYALLDKSHWLPDKPQNHVGESIGTTTRLSQNHHPALTEPPPGSVVDTKNIKKKTIKETKKENLPASPRIDPIYEIFAVQFQQAKGMPYLNKKPDFVQLAELRKKCAATGWELTAERFSKAAKNYFDSEFGAYTLAHLAANFSTFFNSALDRFGKPQQKGNSYAKTGNGIDHVAIVASFKPANRIGG